MKVMMTLAIAGLGALSCQGTPSSSPAASGDPFAKGGGPAPQTVTVTSEDGRTYTGTAAMMAINDPSKTPIVLLTINTSSGNAHAWAAQLALPVDDFARGDVTLALKPWSQNPGTGFIDDQGAPPTFSNSGTMRLQFLSGHRVTATVNSDNPAFSGAVSGTYDFNCFVPAVNSGGASGADPGTPVGGGSVMARDASLASAFCQRFAWLQ